MYQGIQLVLMKDQILPEQVKITNVSARITMQQHQLDKPDHDIDPVSLQPLGIRKLKQRISAQK